MPDMRSDIKNRVARLKQTRNNNADLRLPDMEVVDIAPYSVDLVDNHAETMLRFNLDRPDQPQLPEELEIRLHIRSASVPWRECLEQPLIKLRIAVHKRCTIA